MIRVPRDPDNPTFDDTFNVGVRQLAATPPEERREWERRRDVAAKRRRDDILAAGAAKRAARHTPQTQVARQARRVNRWSAVAVGALTVQLVVYGLLALGVLAAAAAGVWALLR